MMRAMWVRSSGRRLAPASRAALALPLLLAGLGAGCGALDDFAVVIEEEATIDGTYMTGVPTGVDFGGRFRGLSLSTTKSFSDQGADPDDVDAVFVEGIQIVATNPEDTRLDPILRTVTLTLAAPGQPDLELGTATLADGVEVRAVDLTVPSTTNLKPWVVQDGATVGASIELKQAPLFSTTLRTTLRLRVDVNLLGV